MKRAENGSMRIKIKIGAPPQTPEFIALYFKAVFFIKNSRNAIENAPAISFESLQPAQVALQRCPILTTKQSIKSIGYSPRFIHFVIGFVFYCPFIGGQNQAEFPLVSNCFFKNFRAVAPKSTNSMSSHPIVCICVRAECSVIFRDHQAHVSRYF